MRKRDKVGAVTWFQITKGDISMKCFSTLSMALTSHKCTHYRFHRSSRRAGLLPRRGAQGRR
jgi:hypothetical protein